MKPLLTFLFIGVFGLLRFSAHAQGPDKAEYQQRFDKCNAEQQKLRSELAQKRHDREQILNEYRSGQFCSDCKRSKTEVEREMGIPFGQHIAASKTRYIINATPEQIARKKQQLDDDIHNKEIAVDSKRLDCEGISMSYDKAQKAAQERAQADAQRQAQQAATQQADEKAKLLAAQQQHAEEERQRQQAERRAREEAERVRQAQLAANILAYNNRINSNNAETQAKLEEQRRNGNLNGISTYSRESEQNARGTVDNTNSGELRRQAFGDRNGEYLSETSDDAQRRAMELADKANEEYTENPPQTLFNKFYESAQSFSPLAPIRKLKSDFKHSISSLYEQGKNKINSYMDEYPIVKEYLKYRDAKPKELTEFARDDSWKHAANGFDIIANDTEDISAYEEADKKFTENVGPSIYGFFKNYGFFNRSKAEKALRKELKEESPKDWE